MSYLEYIQLVIAEILKGTCFICKANHEIHWQYENEGEHHSMLQKEMYNRLNGHLYITHGLYKARGMITCELCHQMYRVFILNSIAGDYARANNLPYKPFFGE